MQIMLEAMALGFDDFIKRRPYLYHLTSQSNIASIKSTRELYSATNLLQIAGGEHLLRTKRASSVRLTVNGSTITLRDQEPLHAGNLQLRHGRTFGDIVEMLNNHVYFWPGDSSGPSKYGVRHYGRYEKAGERLVMLRVSATELMSANPDNRPSFSRFNSGSPRCSGGKYSPRGDDTFQAESDFTGTPFSVVEVVFRGHVRLPGSVSYGILNGDRWRPTE